MTQQPTQGPPELPEPMPPAPSQGNSGMETYHTIADTVGGVPNLRGKDNLFQAIFVGASIIVCGGVGMAVVAAGLVPGNLWVGLGVGVFAGLVLGTFLSGFALMIVGWIRTTKRR